MALWQTLNSRMKRNFLIVFVLNIQYLSCRAVLPNYAPALQNRHVERDILTEHYFHMGLGYSEILLFLGLMHGCFLSIRQLKRVLKRRGMGRRRNHTDPGEVIETIERELSGSGSTIGYRLMTQRLVQEHGLSIDKESVRQLLKILDPEGVEARSKHRLRRREYKAEGPNHLWHIDGYDKLKPLGFCIHGAIDGFSRRIMWLEVCLPTHTHPY